MAERTKKEVADSIAAINEKIKEQGTFESLLNGLYQKRLGLLAELNAAEEEGRAIDQKVIKGLNKQVGLNKKIGAEVNKIFPNAAKFEKSIRGGAKSFGILAKSGLGFVGIAIAIAKKALEFAKAIADTRKDLGVSVIEAVKLNAAFKGLEVAGKAIGLEAEDFKASFQAAREDLGASTDEAIKLSFNLAKAAMESGTTANQLTQVLSVLESVSSASRDTLLATIETNRRLIEQAGLAPADIFRDIASNAEFFAEFAKDGSNNLVQAGIAAKKLGLNLDAVKGITESLLNFEQSIEGQLEASLLLGRQINLDRARQLALAGDQEGVLQEILKQVGGEAEFNKLNVIQRRALARSVGVNVEQLSRLVRNNTAGGAAGAVGAAVAGAGNTYNDPETHRLLGQLVRNTS